MTTSYAKLDNDRAAQGAVISSVAFRPLGFSGREENLLDTIDSATDEMREIAERWQNRLTVERHTIAENYADGRLSLICDLNILVPDTRIFGRCGVDDRPLNDCEVFASAVFAVNSPNVRNVFLRNQEPMLVFNVECIKTPEGFSTPSLVRLYGIHDEVEDGFGNPLPLLFQSTIDGVYKFIPALADRETGVGVAGCSGLELNIAHNEIKRTSEIVDSVANSKQDFFGRGLIHADLKNAISSLRIVLDQDTVRASVGELSRLSVKIVDVLVGPFDL